MREPETPALQKALSRWPTRASAALVRVELVRTVRRAGYPGFLGDARRQLANMSLIALDDEILGRAAMIEPVSIRSLDAIHLAAALSLGRQLGIIMTYDERMSAAAQELGLPVVSPR
jgi:predicted nucleic acid-binding protein